MVAGVAAKTGETRAAQIDDVRGRRGVRDPVNSGPVAGVRVSVAGGQDANGCGKWTGASPEAIPYP